LLLPIVNVGLPVADFTVPVLLAAEANEPMLSLKVLRSKVAPVDNTTPLVLGRAFVAPNCNVPA